MKEVALIISEDQCQVRIFEKNLREKGYVPFVCKTVPDAVDIIHMAPEAKARVRLVIIDPVILDNIVDDDELVSQLSNCDKCIPFVVMGEIGSRCESTEIFHKLCENRAHFGPEESHLAAELE